MRTKGLWFSWLSLALIAASGGVFPERARAQSPELSMREFSSGQIKKGVRSIGFGGDGASWGNYALVWRDADTALVDYGDTHYTNGNDFHFAAVGATSPALWHNLAIYVIGMFQETNDVRFNAKSPGLGPNPVPLIGTGSDHAFFAKIALPIGKGVSVGVLLSRETSQFDAAAQIQPKSKDPLSDRVASFRRVRSSVATEQEAAFRIQGIAEQRPGTTDRSRRRDRGHGAHGGVPAGRLRCALARGIGRCWRNAPGTPERSRGTHTVAYHPNLGFDQTLRDGRVGLRFGLDETSPTAGFSLKFSRYKLDAAYVHNMAQSRTRGLFGPDSNSVLVTLTVSYRRPKGKRP